MKKLVFLVLVFGFIFNLQVVDAQQFRSIQPGQRGYVPPPKFDNRAAFIELKDPQKELDIVLPKCVEQFKLDAFEQEIFKGLFVKKIEDQNVILEDKGNTREDRKKKILLLNKAFHKDLLAILTPEEVDYFKVMDFSENQEDKKKKKKRRKKKKNKS